MILPINIIHALKRIIPIKIGGSDGCLPTVLQDPDSGIIIEIQWVESLSGWTPLDTSGHPLTDTVTDTVLPAGSDGGEE